MSVTGRVTASAWRDVSAGSHTSHPDWMRHVAGFKHHPDLRAELRHGGRIHRAARHGPVTLAARHGGNGYPDTALHHWISRIHHGAAVDAIECHAILHVSIPRAAASGTTTS